MRQALISRKPRLTAPKPVILQPIHPNAGLRVAYQKRLDAVLAEMHASLMYWLTAKYRANEPEVLSVGRGMVTDESPAAALRAAMRKLARRWQRNFDRLAPELADYFAQAAADRSDSALAATLRKNGFTVRFKTTKAQNDVLSATIGENVNLIRSIASQHLTQVEGAVMRSVQAGRDLGTLTKELQDAYGVTKRRAAFIARDQNNKATATLTRVRQQELGIRQAKWLHSSGGKVPRPTHLANNGKLYDVDKGWFDPDVGKWIRPGELPNCRCISVSVIPSFED